MAMGHVILKEFYVERQVPRFVDYVKKYSDLPFLITVKEKDGAYVPDKFLTSADLGDDSEGSAFKTVLVDSASGRPVVPNGSLGFRYPNPVRVSGTWISKASTRPSHRTTQGPRTTSRFCCRASTSGRRTPRAAACTLRGIPVVPVNTTGGERLVTTVFDLMLAQYGVGRDGLPGQWPTG